MKRTAVVNEGAKVVDICTTLMSLSDLASDGSPLFAQPMFLFGLALCKTSTYCMLTFWLSCVYVNYAPRGEFPLLHRYFYIRIVLVNLSLKNQLPYYTISFSWNKRLLEPKFLCDECSINLYNFFYTGNNTFPLMKTYFPLIKFIGIGAWPVQKLCNVVRRKELGFLCKSHPGLIFIPFERRNTSFLSTKTR